MRFFQLLSIWLGILLIVSISGKAQALVCLQRGELPTAENTHVYEGNLPLRAQRSGTSNGLVWHIHMDIPMECAWSDEKGGELAAEQQSSQPLYVYLDPAWQESTLNTMDAEISVDHGRAIYPLGKRLHVLKSDQNMPTFSLMRICDHHDEWGCRHWRNAPSQDYRMPIAILLPIDLYLKYPLPHAPFTGRLILQVGNNQEWPDSRARFNVPIHFPGNERSSSSLPTSTPYPVPLRKMLRHSMTLLN